MIKDTAFISERRRDVSATIRKIAAAAGVSPATVSRVLNNYPYIKPKVRSLVISTARRMHYTLFTGCIALIIPDHANFSGYLGLILAALRKEAYQRRYAVEIVSECDVQRIGMHLFDGGIAVLYRTGLEKQWGKEQALPLVCINSAGYRNDGVLRISSDNMQGITLALDYLKHRGHRNIIFLHTDRRTPADATDTRERQQCYLSWMNRNAPGIAPAVIEYDGPGSVSFTGLQKQGATAILCPGEGAAAEIFFELRQQGLRVPDDISVIGMEHDELSRTLYPPETTLSQNWALLAHTAFDTLERLIRKLPAADQNLPYTLIERESVASVSHPPQYAVK